MLRAPRDGGWLHLVVVLQYYFCEPNMIDFTFFLWLVSGFQDSKTLPFCVDLRKESVESFIAEPQLRKYQ